MKKIYLYPLPVALLAAFLAVANASATVVLSTDFDNSGVTGGDMTGVVWTENGLTAPTTLSATADVRTGLSGDGDAEGGYFSANQNVNNSTEGAPAWSTTWSLTVGGSDIDLTSIELTSAETNAQGLLGGGNGGSFINLTISGTSIDLTEVRDDDSGASQLLTFSAATTLSANTSYDFTFTLWEEASSGHYEAFDSVTFNAVPEPSAFALLAGMFGLTWAMLRRRA